MPSAIDWDTVFLPAILALLQTGNPYSVPGFYNPPWALLPLVPFALLPYDPGRIAMILCGLSAFAFTLYRLGAKPLPMALVLLTPFVLDSLFWGNVEWLTLLGLTLSPAYGLILLAIKPQMTIGVILFWLVESYTTQGLWNGFIKTIMPMTLVFIISIILFGLFPLRWLDYSAQAGINVSLFPYSVPLGIALMIQAFCAHRFEYALAASPMFFPTLSPQSWMVVFFALASLPIQASAAAVGIWISAFMMGK
jgi:hypothetical protein